MTNLEGRVILRRRAASRRPLACAPTSRSSAGSRRAWARRAASRSTVAADGVRRARGAPARAARPTTRASPTSGSTRSEGVFWPCPTRQHAGTPRLFAERFPTPNGRARFHAVTPTEPPPRSPIAEYPLYLTTGRVLAQYQSGTQTRRVARARRRCAPEPRRRNPPGDRQRARRRRTATLVTRRARAAARRRCRRTADPRHPRGHRLRALPLGRPRVGQPADQPCARSDQPDAGIQGVRGPRRSAVRTQGATTA